MMSPGLASRFAGLFYLITTLTGGFAEIGVRGSVIVPTDAAATARNILASQSFYRLGFAADVVAGAAYAVVTLLLYCLLRPVNRPLAALAAFFSVIVISIGGLASLAHLAPLLARIEEETFSGLQPQADGPRTYAYDPDGRIATITAKSMGAMSYTYDVDGNKLSITEPGIDPLSRRFDLNIKAA